MPRSVARSKPCIVDAVATFWRFLSLCGSAPAHDRVALFRSTVVRANDTAYGVALGFDERAIRGFLRRTETRLDDLRGTQTAFRYLVQHHWARCATALPDLDEDVDLYLLPAPSHAIGGAVRRFGARQAIVFGTEQLEHLRAREVNLGVFMSHEFAHLYHAQVNPEMREASARYFAEVPPTAGARLYQILWLEGFASYVSGRLEPAASASDVLSSSTVEQSVEANRAALAAAVLEGFDSEDRDAIDRFVYWGDPGAGLHPRTGYALGLVTARRLAAEHDLASLARLRGDPLRAALRRALAAYAASSQGPEGPRTDS